jgi:hypothetical protein
MMEAARTSETFVNFYQTTRCYNPEDSNLHTHRRENLKSYLTFIIFHGPLRHGSAVGTSGGSLIVKKNAEENILYIKIPTVNNKLGEQLCGMLVCVRELQGIPTICCSIRSTLLFVSMVIVSPDQTKTRTSIFCFVICSFIDMKW